MEIKVVGRSKQKKADPEKTKEMINQLKKEHSRMVKGKFDFVDAGAGFLEFNYRFFPDDLLVTYKFFHDEVCEIPMGMVKHLNNTVKKIRTFGAGEAGRGTELSSNRGLPSTYSKASRVRFTPIDVF